MYNLAYSSLSELNGGEVVVDCFAIMAGCSAWMDRDMLMEMAVGARS